MSLTVATADSALTHASSALDFTQKLRSYLLDDLDNHINPSLHDLWAMAIEAGIVKEEEKKGKNEVACLKLEADLKEWLVYMDTWKMGHLTKKNLVFRIFRNPYNSQGRYMSQEDKRWDYGLRIQFEQNGPYFDPRDVNDREYGLDGFCLGLIRNLNPDFGKDVSGYLDVGTEFNRLFPDGFDCLPNEDMDESYSQIFDSGIGKVELYPILPSSYSKGFQATGSWTDDVGVDVWKILHEHGFKVVKFDAVKRVPAFEGDPMT